MKIAIVTGGGDCPGTNAVIRAVVRSAARLGWQTVGIRGGYEGLFHPDDIMPLDVRCVGGYLTRGGSVLGTANRGEFSGKVGEGASRELPKELLDRTKRAFDDLGLSAMVVIGGDGTLTTALQLNKHGIPIVGVPKTIDNDLCGTLMTFGFDTAVGCATEALDRLHTTTESHNRIGVLEVMGRHAGWIALYSGVAGGADVVLMKEIPFTYEAVCAKIKEREEQGRHFTIVVVAEGACEKGKGVTTKADGSDASQQGEVKLGGIGQVVTKELEKRTGKEARCCVLGHLQRGGGPSTFDRALCSMYGAAAVDLVAAGEFGKMVAYCGESIKAVPIEEAVGKLKTVPPDGSLVRTARSLGICLGD